MAFIHDDEVMDIVLTQRGRQLLSQGKFKVKYYAFHDDEIDYQAQYVDRPYNAVPFLDLSTGGTFARALSAFYYTQAPTNGTFLATALSNVRRIDSRGDGIGPSLLMEKGATNILRQSRHLATAPWASSGGGSIAPTEAFAAGPDGLVLANRSNVTGAQYSWLQDLSGLMANPHVITAFGKANTGSPDWRPNYSGSAAWSGVLNSSWVRKEKDKTGTGGGLLPEDGTLGGSADVLTDLWQAENGYYPTSPIVTVGTTLARPADTLFYTTGNYPSSFLTNGITFSFAPDASSAEMLAAGEQWYFVSIGTGGNDFLMIGQSGSDVFVVLEIGGADGGQVGPLIFSRGQVLTITAVPSTGTVTVSGATSGNGTDASGVSGPWPSGQTLYIGGNSSGIANVTGRFVNSTIMAAS